MKKNVLFIGLSGAIAVIICSFVLSFIVGLFFSNHTLSGSPYIEAVLYYDYISIPFGLLISVMVVHHVYKIFPRHFYKKLLAVSTVLSISFVVFSWLWLGLYLSFRHLMPRLEGLQSSIEFIVPSFNYGFFVFSAICFIAFQLFYGGVLNRLKRAFL